ncbi:TPR-like protein [Aspergillus japonicus CBS 114.51]|uniref:TPR-like protein n=1 Tax=Aspergillus japonicus CBS 114.51 TaxID=1448312 RepID=A0A8T8X808_ASPJA|nr:TPR-like protein [Aspergillus japonicus CBS 114.51]RAH84268.1 TPR-like protein [Aspergillus japonicus CBS 114.51]
MQSIAFLGVNYGLQIGDNSGPISAEFHLPPVRPETPPEPFSTVPFARDDDYVARGSILGEIQARCARPASRTALVGLGGVGKSQLAIEYSYRVREESPATWVFWVHASNASRLELSYREIADRLQLPGRHDATANVVQLVNSWLYNSKHGKWILILDNLDDESLLDDPLRNSQAIDPGNQTRPVHQPLIGLLPRCPHGAIIFTTRNKAVALKLVSDRDILHINPMDASSALALLRKKLTINTADEEKARKLLEALEFMPLAIIQASAFIQYHAPRYSIVRYLEEFENSSHILDHEAAQPQRDYEACNSALRTWQISFDYIRNSRPTAADLLSLMSFFDRQGIPELLLRSTTQEEDMNGEINKRQKEEQATRRSTDSDFDFEEDIRTLQEFSFIAVRQDPKIFEMHRLVQLAIKRWLEKEGLLSRWQEVSMGNLDRMFPFQSEDQATYQYLFPHLKQAVAVQPALTRLMPSWVSLLMKGVSHAASCGDYRDMEQMGKTLRDASEQLFGSGNLMATFSTEMENLVAQYQRDQDKTIARHLEVIKECQALGGENHYLALKGMDSLTDVYMLQGRLQDAEELGVKVLQRSQQVYGRNHPVTISAAKTLRRVYTRQRRWKAAEELALQDLYFAKQLVGSEHSRTLEAVEDLGKLYMVQGRWQDAEMLLMPLVQTRTRLSGRKDPSTLASIALVAEVYDGQGRLSEAKALYIHVLEMQGEDHTEDDPFTTKIRAILERRDKGLDSTTSLYRRIVEFRQGPLGDKVLELIVAQGAPKSISIKDHLGAMYYKHGKWKDAEEVFLKALETRTSDLGEAHIDTVSTRGKLGAVYIEQERWVEAEEVFLRTLDVLSTRSLLSEEERGVNVDARMKLGIIFAKQERWKGAEDQFRQVLESNSAIARLDAEQLTTVSTEIGLEALYSGQKRLSDAATQFSEFLSSRGWILGGKHPRAEIVKELLELVDMMQKHLQTGHEHVVKTLDLMKQAACVTASIQLIHVLQNVYTAHSPVLNQIDATQQALEKLMSELNTASPEDRSLTWMSYLSWTILVSIFAGAYAFYVSYK